MQKRPIKTLSIAHTVCDLNQGALPVMLPFFIMAYDLSYAAAAGIVFALNMSSSIVQPIFGVLADRSSKPWILPLSVFLAGLGISLTGYFDSYTLLIICAIITGTGVAAYHPVAARLVNKAAGAQKATAMSIFGVGGTVGFALGPIIMSFALGRWELAGSAIMLVPALLAVVLLVYSNKELMAVSEMSDFIKAGATKAKDDWRSFLTMAGIVSLRSIFFFGLNTFVPIYWIKVLGASKIEAAVALSVFCLSGIAGNIAGGTFADKFGRKQVLLVTMSFLVVLVPLFVTITHSLLAMVALTLVGLMFYAGYSSTITLGQSYLPNRIGLSSGVTLGLAVAIGGGTAPLVGKIADLYSISTAMTCLACMPIFPLLLSFTLPNIDKK